MQSKEEIERTKDNLKELYNMLGEQPSLSKNAIKNVLDYIEQLETEKQELIEKLEKTINAKNVLVETTKLQKILYKDTIEEMKEVITKAVNEYRKEILKIVQGEKDE